MTGTLTRERFGLLSIFFPMWNEEAYLHRGIASRGFIRSFVLADGMVVEGATLEHGLLHIDVNRPEPEKRVQQIPIRAGG